MMFSREDLIEGTGATVLKCTDIDDNASFNISTDTRTIQKGDIYLPLKGETFDGENFIDKALESGAVGYFTTGDKIFNKANFALKVPDTKEAYLKLAKL